MQKIFSLMILLMLFVAAFAEARYTGADDIYYHAIPDCMGHDYSETAATGGLYSCPVCVPDDTDYGGLRFFDIGGLTVVRMSDEFIRTREDVGSVFGYTSPDLYVGKAEAKIADYLHGDDYLRFKAEMRENGEAAASAPFANSTMDANNDQYESGVRYYVGFCSRHIGGAWVEVMPPFAAMNGGELNPRFFTGEMTWSNGALSVHQPREWDDYLTEPDIEDCSGIEPSWVCDGEGWALKLYEAEDMSILTIRVAGEDAILEPKVSVHCAGWPSSVYVNNPWRDGDDCLYGVALSRGEAETLKTGTPEISYNHLRDVNAEYDGTPYAIIETETDRPFVIDRERAVIIPPDYDYVGRIGNVFVCENWGFGVHSSCAVCDAAHGSALMEAGGADDMFLTPYERLLDVRGLSGLQIYRAGDDVPTVVLEGSEDMNAVTLHGSPDIYILGQSAAIASRIDAKELRPTIPEDTFAAVFETDEDCAVVIWNLEGGEAASLEALGLAEPIQKG